MSLWRRYKGAGAAQGVVAMDPDPDYSMGKETADAWIGTMGVKRMSLQVQGLSGVITFQGNNGDPAVANQWYTLDTLNSDGTKVVVEQAVNFVRVNKTTHSSGTAICILTLEA